MKDIAKKSAHGLAHHRAECECDVCCPAKGEAMKIEIHTESEANEMARALMVYLNQRLEAAGYAYKKIKAIIYLTHHDSAPIIS